MFALLAYKRPSLIEGRYQLAFEIRTFGCFNGFNVENAFTTSPGGNGNTQFDVIFDNLDPDGTIPRDYFWGGTINTAYPPGVSMYHRPKSELNFDNVTVTGGPGADLLSTSFREEGRPWECLGIGYLCYAVGNCQLSYQPPAVQNPGGHWVNPQWNGWFQPQASQYGMNGRITTALNRNRIDKSYYDHYNGDTMLSHRDPTPNESFLQNFLWGMRQEAVPAEMRYSLKSSRVILAITHSYDYHSITFDLVGSERPSGLAVSYLQAFRNISEKIWAGMKSTVIDKAQESCLLAIAENWPYSTLDPIPLMAYVCNNGDDSDIIAYAGQKFVMYATKMGLFNCASLYRRSDSMLIEGRYNKGGQSAHISTAIGDKIAARGPQVFTQFDQAMATVTKLSDYKAHMQKQPDAAGLATAMSTWAAGVHTNSGYTDAERERMIIAKAAEYGTQLSNWLEAHGRFRIKEILKQIRGSASALTSFRTRQSNIELAPNPLGFTAWVRQAEGVSATIEGAAPEEPTGVPPTLDAGRPVAGAAGAAPEWITDHVARMG